MKKLILSIVILMKIQLANAQITFQKTYGGMGFDRAGQGNSLQQTTDGGYIVVGTTSSFGVGIKDVYLIKTDSTGDTLWTKTFGGMAVDQGFAVSQTTDGGYILAGSAYDSGFGVWNNYLIKTDAIGDTIWTKTIGGVLSHNFASSVVQAIPFT